MIVETIWIFFFFSVENAVSVAEQLANFTKNILSNEEVGVEKHKSPTTCLFCVIVCHK